MMNKRISFAEEDIQRITTFYNNYLEKINEHILELIHVFREYKEKTKYEVIAKEGNLLIEFYNDKMATTIKNVTEEWAASENSLEKIAKRINAGDSAVENAKDITNRMIDSLDEYLVIQEEISLNDTAEVEINSEIFTELENEVKTKTKDLADSIYDAKRKYEEFIEENTAANSLKALLNIVEGTVLLPFKELGETVISELLESFDESMIDSIDIAETGATAAKEEAENKISAEQDTLLLDMVKLFSDE